MVLGHFRANPKKPLAAEPLPSTWPHFIPKFDSQALLARFEERFGSDPELDALAKEKDPEFFWEGLLSLAGSWERRDRLEPAAALFEEVAGAAHESHPQLSARAERALQSMTGEGEGGARFEFLLRRFLRDASDPSMIAAFGVGSLAFRAAKLGVLSRLWSPGQGFFLGRSAAGLVASAAGLITEAPTFLFTSKLGRQLVAGPQDWRAETVAHELAGIGLTLLCLKGAGALSQKAAQQVSSHRFALAAISQAGMLTGILAARRLEESLGLRPRMSDATLLTDALATQFQLLVGGNLAERALGPKFRGFQSALEWRAPRSHALDTRDVAGISPATAGLGSADLQASKRPSIQELAQGPLLSSASDDSGDGHNSGGAGLRYGYGKDTVMGRWFPENAKPSNAVPMFTSAVGRIPQMLRAAYQHRPDWQHPRTILLEHGLEALQKISPSVEVTTDLLNNLTKDVANQVPEKTPFRIMQVSERRTFTAQVQNRSLLWTEVNDPLWGRSNRHSATNEFDAETPLELYLYIESLTRQPNPSYQADYRIQYQGRSPAAYEVSLVKFLERSLRFYRIAGRSLSLEFQDGGISQRIHTSSGEWTSESTPDLSPARTAPLSPTPPSAGAARRGNAIFPFAVVHSVQGLKDFGSLLADPSVPRRIELWLQSPTRAGLEGEIWRSAFRDLRPGSILVIHDSQARKSFTFQRREDRIISRSAPWSGPLAWEPGIPLSSRDVMDLFQQLHFIRNSKVMPGQTLTVSLLGDWEPYHDKMLLQQLNFWGDVPFEKIEIRNRGRAEILLRFRRNHAGKFISD